MKVIEQIISSSLSGAEAKKGRLGDPAGMVGQMMQTLSCFVYYTSIYNILILYGDRRLTFSNLNT